MLLCYNSQSIFSLCILNLSNVMESDCLVPCLPPYTASIRIEFLIKKCCVQGTQHLSFICLRELILRLFLVWRPSLLVTWRTCFWRAFTAQRLWFQAVHGAIDHYLELGAYGTMPQVTLLPTRDCRVGSRVFNVHSWDHALFCQQS